jgi:hypothetical protein
MPTVDPTTVDLATPSTDPWAYSLRLPRDPRAARIARVTLRAVLAGHAMGHLADTAELLTSELVTNALRYSSGPSEIRLRGGLEPGRLRVSVWDTNPLIPAPFDRPPGPESYGRAAALARAEAEAAAEVAAATGTGTGTPGGTATRGRGVQIVRMCADNWGGYPLGDALFGMSGKLLWFELAA